MPFIAFYYFTVTALQNKVAKKYQSIWLPQGSPLLVISYKQLELLQANLRLKYADTVQVALAMSYSEPSISQALTNFRKANISRIIALPLYPIRKIQPPLLARALMPLVPS